jgi:hypothetical protein
MAGFDYIKGLSSLAEVIKTSAIKNAPYKTGNLKSKLQSYNTLQRMIKPDGKGIKFVAGPPGAEYGKYWNSPYGKGDGRTATIKKRYPKHFDFRDNAYEDPGVQQALREFAREVEIYLVKEFNAK